MASRYQRGGRRLLRRVAFGLLSLAVLGAVLLGGLAWWLRTTTSLVEAGAGYERTALFDSFFLYDLGTADMNGDGSYDIFTTNHGADQAFRLNDGAGGFSENAMSALGFDYTPAYPGLRAYPELPPVAGPGLYVDQWRSTLVIRAVGQGGAPLGGRLSFDWPATAVSEGAMTVARLENGVDDGGTSGWTLPPSTSLRFGATGPGLLLVEPQPAPTDGLAFDLVIDPAVPLERIFIGPQRVSPWQRTIRISTGDRHGMAWADVDADGAVDVFISLGGLRGRAAADPSVRDEFYFGGQGNGSRRSGGPVDRGRVAAARDGVFVDRIAATGITKAGCPGRRAAWVDIDNDGRLDLYQVCGRGGSGVDRAAVANRLYMQGPDGRFSEAAAAWGLAIEAYGNFFFFDADGDGWSDLFWAGRDRYTIYRNTGERFEAEDLGPTPPGPGSRLRQITVGDIDGDGFLEVFVASRDGNTLFANDAGALSAVPPTSLGLPERAHTANWVDSDNSGRLDLAAFPGGLYRQDADGRFNATGILAARLPFFLNDARAAWFDADGDGTLDAVVAERVCWPGRICAAEERGLALLRRAVQQYLGMVPHRLFYEPLDWQVSLLRGEPPENLGDNHWLAVDVQGAAGNPESIGAQLTLEVGDRRQVAEVGQLEGAHQSQGNYRLHFGLGDATEVARLLVRWPDGAERTIEAPAVDRLIEVTHPKAAPLASAEP